MNLTAEEQNSLKQVRAEYNQLFETDPIRDEERAYAWLAKKMFREKPDAKQVLDIACGGGHFLKALSNCYGTEVKYAGVDLSSKALEIAKQSCPGAKLYEGPAEELPFGTSEFDVVSCLGSLEHFVNMDLALKEIRRVLAPGGKVFILVPNILWFKDILAVLLTRSRKSRNQTHERFLSLGEWEEILRKEGFNILRSRKYNGIAKSPAKQLLKDILIPLRFSYHFLFICTR